MKNSEACRLVGINRRTGTRWRFGRTVTVEDGRVRHYPAVPIPPRRAVGCPFLSEDERSTIADLRRTGPTLRTIGVELAGIQPPSAVNCAAASTPPRANIAR